MQEHVLSQSDTLMTQETFAKYLKHKRKERRLTQDLLAQSLSACSRVLSGIDAVTISRWERSMTEPTLERQRHVISFFGDNPDSLLPFHGSRRRSGPRSDSLSYIVRHFVSSPRIGAKVGTFPEVKNAKYSIESILNHVCQEAFTHLTLEYQQSIHYCPSQVMSEERFLDLIKANRGYAKACTRYGHYSGHLVGFYLKPEAFGDLIHGRMAEMDLERKHLAAPGERFSFYLFSSYSCSRLVAAHQLLALVRTLPRNGDNLTEVGGTAFTSDGARLYKTMHLNPVSAGCEVQEKGVRYQGREVAFLTFSATAQSLRQERDLGYLLQD